MSSIDSDAELAGYLQLAAEAAGVSVTALLRQVLHVNPLTEEPGFQQFFGSIGPEALALFTNLDLRLRILNPGLHYVFRTTYFGYRREGSTSETVLSERSQIFLSVLPRTDFPRVVLPVDPAMYAHLSGCRVLTGQGHHGVGDLLVEVPNEEALDRFFKTFHGWLARPSAIPDG
jgi:hypothetical protein